jgi:DNA-binding CsgD family transcriptional regulator
MGAANMYEVIVNSLVTHVAVLDEKGRIVETNQAWQQFARENGMTGRVDCVGINYLQICEFSSAEGEAISVAEAIRRVIRGELAEFITRYPCHSPSIKRWYTLRVLPYRDKEVHRVIVTHEDITPLIVFQEDLRAKEEELRQKAEQLEETNIALKVLLDHRSRDRQELENRFLANIRELVLPSLAKLKTARLPQREKTIVGIIEEHLHDIASPFLTRLATLHLLLTPQEVEVALLVRQGKSSQEIADVLNIAVSTVSFHRKQLRKKLELDSRDQNLRTYLLSLQ